MDELRRLSAWTTAFNIDKNLSKIQEVMQSVSHIKEDRMKIYWYKQGYFLMTQDVPDKNASFTLEDVVPRTFAARGEMVEAKKLNSPELYKFATMKYQDCKAFMDNAKKNQIDDFLDNLMIIKKAPPYRARKEFSADDWEIIYLQYQKYLNDIAPKYKKYSGYGDDPRIHAFKNKIKDLEK